MFTFPVFFAISVLVGGAVGIVVNNRSARRRAASYAPGFKDPLTPNRGERPSTPSVTPAITTFMVHSGMHSHGKTQAAETMVRARRAGNGTPLTIVRNTPVGNDQPSPSPLDRQ